MEQHSKQERQNSLPRFFILQKDFLRVGFTNIHNFLETTV